MPPPGAGAGRAVAGALLLGLLAGAAAGCARTPLPPAGEAPEEAGGGALPPPPPFRLAVCPPRQGRVRLVVQDPEPVLATDLGVDALHGRTGLRRRATAHHLGLTTSSVEWRSELEVRYARAPVPRQAAAIEDGEERPPAAAGASTYCAVPGGVTLTLALTEHRMRVAREIPEGGCLFAEVEAHERRHVAVNREALRLAARRMRAAAEAWAREAEGRGATLEEAKAALGQGLRRAVEPALAAMREAQARGHAEIDTPQEYRRLARVCPEDHAVLRQRIARGGGGGGQGGAAPRPVGAAAAPDPAGGPAPRQPD